MKIKLSLKPLAEARWETHETTGAEFLIAPLIGELDQELVDKASNMMGQVNSLLFAGLAAPQIVKDWRHVSDEKGEPAACNEQNLKTFVAHHGLTIMPWIIRRSRSLDHYRHEEGEEAKKG